MISHRPSIFFKKEIFSESICDSYTLVMNPSLSNLMDLYWDEMVHLVVNKLSRMIVSGFQRMFKSPADCLESILA
jgi:hypothetical protein